MRWKPAANAILTTEFGQSEADCGMFCRREFCQIESTARLDLMDIRGLLGFQESYWDICTGRAYSYGGYCGQRDQKPNDVFSSCQGHQARIGDTSPSLCHGVSLSSTQERSPRNSRYGLFEVSVRSVHSRVLLALSRLSSLLGARNACVMVENKARREREA